MPVKHYGIWMASAPNVRLEAEGLGRLLANFIDGTRAHPDVQFTLLCPSWSKDNIQELLRQERITVPISILSPPGQALAVRIFRLIDRWRKRPRHKRHRLRRFAAWTKSILVSWLTVAGHRLSSARSWPEAIFLSLLFVIIAIALLAPAICLGLVIILALLSRRALAAGVGNRTVQRLRTTLARLMGSPKQSQWAVALYQHVLHQEMEELVILADKQEQVQAWYVPAAFWPEACRCRAPQLICVPDVVLASEPVGFAAVDDSNRFVASLSRIEQCLAQAKAFTTYSATTAQETLVDRYGITPERVAIIPHAAARLDDLVELRGMPDNVTASRAYCRSLLRPALSKAIGNPYPGGFDNLEFKFLFYASQFRPSKNILSLIRSYEHLLRRHYIPHKLVLTGNPAALPGICDFIATHRLQRDVLFLHGLSSRELAACYKLADLAVNPTFSEGGCPFTFTEALSVGTPVVMSRIGVTTEVITDPFLQDMMLFDPRNQQEMIRRIHWAIEHRDELLTAQLPVYQRLAQRTWGDVVGEHIAALDRLASASQQ